MRPSRRPALKLDWELGSARVVRGESMPYGLSVAKTTTPADVAELVDALVSGTSGGNIVGVQVSPSALP